MNGFESVKSSSPHYQRLLAARILSEANDLKRTPAMLASELGLSVSEVQQLLDGQCDKSDLLNLVQRMASLYPIDGAELLVPEDDCDGGARIFRAAESRASGRISQRRDASGEWSAYYEYRDTACSRLSPFRPEWIRPLRITPTADCNDPHIVFNKGHLLHQYTYYVGDINFYWRTRAAQGAEALETGDSTYGTPWWPHTFATRDEERRSYILAVTFGANVRRAQREIYVLGKRIRRYVVNYRENRRAQIELLKYHLESEMMTEEQLLLGCARAGKDVRSLLDEAATPSQAELNAAAALLSIQASDLEMPPYSASEEVIITKRERTEPTEFPARQPRYLLWRMARIARMPQVKGFGVQVVAAGSPVPDLCTGLHSWLYNYGSEPTCVTWDADDSPRTALLDPGDSMYIQPFVAHGFSTRDRPASLCLVRVPGAVDLATQRELSYLSEVDRVILEHQTWA